MNSFTIRIYISTITYVFMYYGMFSKDKYQNYARAGMQQ